MKKNTKIVVLVSTVAMIATLAIFFKGYYNDRYVESGVVYVKVPMDQSLEFQDMLDDKGNVMDQGREYEFTGYTEEGETHIVEFSLYTEDVSELLQPGEYLRVSVSNTLVLNQKVIPESEVPSKVLKLLNK